MVTRSVDAEIERRKRRLRVRIGRLRRRLDGRARATRRQFARLTSWRTYARRYPGHALLVALGLGISLSAGLGGGRWLRLLGIKLISRVGQNAGQKVWEEFLRIWQESASEGKGKGGDVKDR
jgi:hypothetical protein